MTFWCAVLLLMGLTIEIGLMAVLWAASAVSGREAEADEDLQER